MMFALKLLGFGKMLLGFAVSAFKWLLEKPHRLIIAILAVLSVMLLLRGNGLADERDAALAGWKAEKAAHQMTVELYRAASAKALADAEANKARIEAKYKDIENAQDKAIRARIDAATSSLRQRAATANTSGSNAVGLPRASGSPVDPAGDGQNPVMDDALICTENTVKAQGWLDWYNDTLTVK